MDLRADHLTLRWTDQTFTPEGADVTVRQDIFSKGQWTLYARWDEDGHDNALRLRFRSTGSDWFVESIRWMVTNVGVPDGGRAYLDFEMGASDATRTRLGQPFSGDLDLGRPKSGSLVTCVTPEPDVRYVHSVPAHVSIEGLRLAVAPRERSLLDKALRFVG